MKGGFLLTSGFLTPASFAALSLKLYVAPGSKLATVHCSSRPWYTSAGVVSPSLISRLYTHSSHTPSHTGESADATGRKQKNNNNLLSVYIKLDELKTKNLQQM